jgi:hypothetical protein
MWSLYRSQTLLQAKLDILQGTLDLMVLRALSTLGSLHGYGIARRIEQVSGDRIILNQGTIYTSLVRLEQRGWIRSNHPLLQLRIERALPCSLI